MIDIKKDFKKIVFFVLGAIFASCITALADTCTTTLPGSNVTVSGTGNSNVEASISELESKANSLSTRLTNIDVNGELTHVEFTTLSTATHGGYIDFHYGGNNSVDHTSRIIEMPKGVIKIEASNGILFNNTDVKTLFKTKKFTNSSSVTISSGSASERTFSVALSGYTPVGIIQVGGSGTTGTGFIDVTLSGTTVSLWISNPSSSSKTVSSTFVVVLYIKDGYVSSI